MKVHGFGFALAHRKRKGTCESMRLFIFAPILPPRQPKATKKARKTALSSLKFNAGSETFPALEFYINRDKIGTNAPFLLCLFYVKNANNIKNLPPFCPQKRQGRPCLVVHCIYIVTQKRTPPGEVRRGSCGGVYTIRIV